ncbi:OLC1v1024841C1 [Oldenlandia corymbosa var. corymbosa]|uniref:OLC1v1024841C1 n=1 Tax=Oldenlandia corymbosa var. corymbosa TaxID=529605 RepID=A0AAV1C4P6_OLDCO|nr:OLC1v1024841C1 [Oldenlandia corymbosa var. corymbosa]
MASLHHSLYVPKPLFHKPFLIPSYPFPKLPSNSGKLFLLRQNYRLLCLPSRPPTSMSFTADDHQQILEAVADSNEEVLPAVRTYEDSSARLTVVGAVEFQQALTAAAADGGRAADQHILAGLQAMVVETIFPGPPDENSTLSTRLFLPARKVKAKVKTLKGFMDDDLISSTTSENILAMTFRQVVLRQLWRFELLLFRPGTERNMNDLENPREVPAMFSMSSCDERVLAVLAEVICSSALEGIEGHFGVDSLKRKSNKFSEWFQKHKKIVSKDSSIIVHKLHEKEILSNVKNLLETYNAEKFESLRSTLNNSWWKLPSYSQLEKIGGSEFTAWISEYIPLYRLQIDVNKFKDVKHTGGKFSATNMWEILLTHSQMVSLANILDMFYEDDFTLPAKELSSGAVMELSNISHSKSNRSFFKLLSATIAGGLFIVTLTIMSQLRLPSLPRWRKYFGADSPLQSSSVRCIQPESLEDVKFVDYCTSVIRKVKDSFGWPGEIRTEAGLYAWTGDLPLYLRKMSENGSTTADVSSSGTMVGEGPEDIRASMQDIASYQVVLSNDRKIVGFQPTSRMAVNHWASNPLAKELYAGRILSPGLIEPGLKIPQLNEVVVLELLMSANSGPHFAFVRPVDIS